MISSAKRIIILLFFSIPSYSFTQKLITGANHLAMGGISTLYNENTLFQNNASFLAHSKSTSINASTNSSYLSSEIATHSISFASPLKNKSGLGVHLTRDGISSFNTSQVGISYGKSISKRLAIGVNTNLQYLEFQKQHSKLIILPEVSLSGDFNKNWKYGLILHNPTRQAYNKELHYNSSSQLLLGINYTKDNYSIAVELNKTSHQPSIFTLGSQLNVTQNASFYIGFKSNSSLSGGLSYKHESFHLALATAYHTSLGFSPSLSLLYDFQD